MLSESIAKLVQYGITTGLTPECERNYTTNLTGITIVSFIILRILAFINRKP